MNSTTMKPRRVRIETPDATLHGDIAMPPGASGIVLFAHGSGSSRHSPRNRQVAEALHESGFATLLMDLLTEHEERDLRTRAYRFDVDLMARRLAHVVDWVAGSPAAAPSHIGLFGASTGAAAALICAAERAARVHAVVSRGGRPDLAGPALRPRRRAHAAHRRRRRHAGDRVLLGRITGFHELASNVYAQSPGPRRPERPGARGPGKAEGRKG